MKVLMSKAEMRSMSHDGETPVDILRAAIATGLEFPDAVWRVKDALNLNEEAFNEMEDKYMEPT